MKKTFFKIVLLGIMVITPFVTHAAGVITEKSFNTTSSSYTVTYEVTTAPSTSAKVYVRLTEYNTTKWNYDAANGPISTITDQSLGKTFNAEFSFANLSIAAGKKYVYYLADGTKSSSTLLTNPKCFTTTGQVACDGATTNPTLNEQSFSLEQKSQAADPNSPGKYLVNFGITRNVVLLEPIQVSLKIYEDSNGTPKFLKQGNFQIGTGNGVIFPTVEDLAPGNYSVILYSGPTMVSREIGFIVKTNGASGPKASFKYNGLPSVTCDASIALCDFKIMTNITAAGTLEFKLFGYPKTEFEGKKKEGGVELKKDAAITVAVGQREINTSMTFAEIAAFTKNVNDGSFWFNFFEVQNNIFSDVGNPLVSAQENIPFTLNLVTPPKGSLDFTDGPSSDATGVCGSAAGSTSPALTSSSANLCAKGTVTEFNYDGFNYSWKCKGSDGTMRTCTATGGKDTNYGDGFLKNPLAPGLDTFPKIFAAVYNNIILPIAIPFIVLAIMYAGFKFVIARKEGRVDGYADAKRVLKYTLIGTALLLGGWVVANALQGTLNSLLGPGSGKTAVVTVLEHV